MVIKKLLDIINEHIEDEKLRAAFQRENNLIGIGSVKATCILGIIFYLLFGGLDFFIFPDQYIRIWMLRIFVILMCIVIYFFINAKWVRDNSQYVGMLMLLVSGIAIATMCHMTGGPKSIYYAGINLTILVMIFILPLKAKQVALVCLLVYAYYVFPAVVFDSTDYSIVISNSFFLITTMVLSIVGSMFKNKVRLNELKSRINIEKVNEDLKKMDEQKTQLFTNISHELKTPLSNIVMPLESLQSHIYSNTKTVPIKKSIFESMLINAGKLHKLVDDFLDFNRLEKGMMTLQCRLTDINQFLVKLVMAVSPSMVAKKIEIVTKFPETPVMLYLDPWKIDKIFPNLISNALKFTLQGGVLTLSLIEDERTVKVLVADNGIGIPQDQLGKIFERFYQVDGTQTRGYGGTGIGLSLTKSFIELHHGTIEVSSKVDKGTTFTVTFLKGKEHLSSNEIAEEQVIISDKQDTERRQAERRQEDRRYEDAKSIQLSDITNQMSKQKLSAEIAREEQSDMQKEGPLIQIVEDDPGIVQNLRDLLKDQYRIRVAFDGEEGWDKILSDPPDLIISDIMMPKMDGYKLTEFIKTNPRTQHIPVIILTAKGDFTGKIRGLKEGAIDYLTKPVNPIELTARISNHIAQIERQKAQARLEEMAISREEVIVSFAESLAARDKDTAGHSKEVLRFGCLINDKIGLVNDHSARYSFLMHDIGKIAIPDSILLKEGRLSNMEFELIKTHPQLGADLVKHCRGFEKISENILSHQEKFDGTGYPRGLKEEGIPIVARVIAVADTYHVMTHERPYKKASTPQEAVKELIKHKETQFDPRIVDAFLEVLMDEKLIIRNDVDEVTGTI